METSEPLILFGTDVVSWAYAKDENDWGPIQDWDIILAQGMTGEFLLQLASDKDCPKRAFFLHCLYIRVGDCVRTLHHDQRIFPGIEPLLEQAALIHDPLIIEWLERSKYLMTHPETFDYDFWCNGGFARNLK
jgi:hypothetical protein